MVSRTVAEIEQLLREAFSPPVFELIDNSHLHAGHAGNTMGGSHIAVYMVSPRFEGVNTLGRHRMVYAVLKEAFKGPLHAVELNLKTPIEHAAG
jgi:BolA family transcriptional regulator, general stress-responsive regulator